MKSPEAIIRDYFAAYEAKDRAAAEAMIAPDFTFTSPLDDNIDRGTYFERCWPNSEHLDEMRIEKLFAEGNEVFVNYHAKSKDGSSNRNTEFFTVREGQITHVDVYFGSETGEEAMKEEIRTVIDAWAQAIRDKDVKGVLSHLSPDVVQYQLAPPLQTKGSGRGDLEAWFDSFEGNIGYELSALTIHANGSLACCYGLHRLTGTKSGGEKADLWFRATLCLQQNGREWTISHIHESVPFLMDGSFKAAVELKP